MEETIKLVIVLADRGLLLGKQRSMLPLCIIPSKCDQIVTIEMV